MIMLYVCLFFNVYVPKIKPFMTRLKNTTEFFNEVTIFYATSAMLLFTDFVPNVDMKNNCGWIIIGGVLFNMAINWGILLA